MFKRAFALILSAAIALSMCACRPNKYETGVPYEEYPDDDVPLFEDAVVFDCTDNEQEAVFYIAYGSDSRQEDIVEFYTEYFETEHVALYLTDGASGATVLSGTTPDGHAFKINIREDAGDLSGFYATVTEVALALHAGALFTEDTLTPLTALAAGVLQYYPTGHEAYDAARLKALLKVRELTDDLNEKTEAMLGQSAGLASMLDEIWDMPRTEVAWPVLYNLNSASIAHLQAACLLDDAYLEYYPAQLRQTAAPLGALTAASCMQDAVMHLLTALSFYASLQSARDASSSEDFWKRVMDFWEEAEPDFDDMCVEAEKLDALVSEIVGTDGELYDTAMEELGQSYDALRERVTDYMDEASDKSAEKAQTILDTYGSWITADTEDASMRSAMGDDAYFMKAGYMQGCGLLTGQDDEKYDQSADRLDKAVEDSDEKRSKPDQVSYPPTYDTDDAEGVIALFVLSGIEYAPNTPDPQPVTESQEIKPIELWFPTDTGNDKVNAFHTVMNATLEAAHERGYDPDLAAAVMKDELNEKDRRDTMGSMFGCMELDMLVLGALKAAEDRNNAASNAGQNGTLTGDAELDKLLAILMTQSSSDAGSSGRVRIDGSENLPESVKEATDRICDDPVGKKLVDRDVPVSPDAEEDVNDALTVMTGSGDDADGSDTDNAPGTDALTGSLKRQITTAVSSKTDDSENSDNFSGSIIDGIKEFRSMMIAQVFDDMLEDFKTQFSKDPVKAVEDALDKLIEHLSGLNGFEQWAQLLKGLKDAVSSNLIWQALADAVTGDYTAMEGASDDGGTADADDKPGSSSDTGVTASPSPGQADGYNDGVVPVEFDYSGYYALEFTLLDYVYEIQPYDPDNHSKLSESEWYEKAEQEQENEIQKTTFSYKQDNIQVWHEPGSDIIYLEHGFPVDISYQPSYELEDGSGMVNSTVYFRAVEASDGFGYITFAGGDDGGIAIIGEVTEYFEGMLNHLERHFRIDGVQITEEEYYSW